MKILIIFHKIITILLNENFNFVGGINYGKRKI